MMSLVMTLYKSRSSDRLRAPLGLRRIDAAWQRHKHALFSLLGSANEADHPSNNNCQSLPAPMTTTYCTSFCHRSRVVAALLLFLLAPGAIAVSVGDILFQSPYVRVDEGTGGGTGTATITVDYNGTGDNVTVQYKTENEVTVTAGGNDFTVNLAANGGSSCNQDDVDYVSIDSGTLTFGQGAARRQTIKVTICDDSKKEQSYEQFAVTLFNPRVNGMTDTSVARLGADESALVSIYDDD